MSRLVARILLSLFMFPLASIFYIFVFVASDQAFPMRSEHDGFLFSSGLTWLFVAVYWCLLWRSGIDWNSARLRRTFIAAFGTATIGIVVGYFCGLTMGGTVTGVFIGGVLAIVLWLIATVFIWRETAAERAARMKASGNATITCPTCGYNLTGLSECRCPECGSRFTLDELMALQPSADKEIE